MTGRKMVSGKTRTRLVVCFLLLFAVSMLFMSLTDVAWAEEEEGISAPDKTKYLLNASPDKRENADAGVKGSAGANEGEDEEGDSVHKNPETFEKNFDLTWEQKEETIKKINEFVEEKINPGMSDLEKYYTLAAEANKLATYDWDFWGGSYDFDYYSHQWDSYGVMNETSVCVGIAIFYSHLCHAADLPCWFVRMDPNVLDHTISYIPDINGNPYYMDVTENMSFMSEKSNNFTPLDKAFSHITKDCDVTTFDYAEKDEGEDEYSYHCGIIKTDDGYYPSYEEWFKEFARHEDTDKTFPTPYEEKGSGLKSTEAGHKHVSYNSMRSNFVENPDIWFLDDFYTEGEIQTASDGTRYTNPGAIKQKILNKQFDDQLVNVSIAGKNYDCATQTDLEAAVAGDIAVQYFPSVKDGEVVAETADLVKDTDYELACTKFDLDTNTAEFKVTGKGSYQGAYTFEVKLNSAVVTKAPVSKKGLKYAGKAFELIEAGEAENGTMQYALGTEEGPTEDFSTELPKATDAGKYYVWYKAVANDSSHSDSEPARLERPVTIAPIEVRITADDISIGIGETASINPRIDGKIQVRYKFTIDNEDIATIDDKGNVTGISAGGTYIEVSGEMIQPSPNYKIEGGWAFVEVRPDGTDISETKIRFNESSLVYNGKVQRPTIKTIKGWYLVEGEDYTVKWSNPSSKNAGTYTVTVTGIGDYIGTTDATYTIQKAPNTMKLKAKAVKFSRKSLKKKSKSIKRSKALSVSKAKGKLSYKLVSAKKGKKSFKKKFKVNTKTGKITAKKGLKKGTYKVKVKVKAKGTTNYAASAWKTVTIKVKVK